MEKIKIETNDEKTKIYAKSILKSQINKQQKNTLNLYHRQIKFQNFYYFENLID